MGTEVEFIVRRDRSGKPAASDMTVLPTGTVVFDDVLPERLRGQITRGLESRGRRQDSASGLVLLAPGEAARARQSEDQGALELPFSAQDLQDPAARPRPGDTVEVSVAVNRASGAMRATSVRCLPAQREQGWIDSLKDKYGFIRCADRGNQRIFFHYTELRGSFSPLVGQEVEFTVAKDGRTDKDAALAIEALPSGTVRGRDPDPVAVKAVVVAEALPAAGGAPLEGEEGVLLLRPEGDEDPASCYFSRDSVEPGVELRVGDEVEALLPPPRPKQPRRALMVRLVSHPAHVDPSALPPVERGQVQASKHTKFGFIRSVERAADVFYHRTAFARTGVAVESLKEGQDVEFQAVPDPSNPRKLMAVNVRLAAAGSGSTHAISEEVLVGLLTEKATASARGNAAQSGLIEYIGGEGKSALPYSLNEENRGGAKRGGGVRAGDFVSFRIHHDLKAEALARRRAAEAAQQGTPGPDPKVLPLVGKRAVQVHPMWFTGRVSEASLSTGKIAIEGATAQAIYSLRTLRALMSGAPTGIETSAPNQAGSMTVFVPFHQSDVEEGAGTLFEGDQVEALVREELVFTGVLGWVLKARRIVLTSQGPRTTRPGVFASASAAGAGGAAPRQSAIKPDDKHGVPRVSRGPDGTKGFVLWPRGRGKPPARPGAAAAAPAPGSIPMPKKVHLQLNSGASEFKPSSPMAGST